MRIINKTDWKTADLKKILTRALNEDDKIEGKYLYRNRLEIEIVYSKGPRKWVVESYKKRNLEMPEHWLYSGYAYYSGNLMRLRVPKREISKALLAKMFIHEMGHIRGHKHSGMGRWLDIETLWIEDDEYQIKKKEIKGKPREDLQLKRYNHVIEMIKQKEKILKRLRNQIKKWNAKKRYYQRVLTAAGKIKSERKGEVNEGA